jgi:hypothetical protein
LSIFLNRNKLKTALNCLAITQKKKKIFFYLLGSDNLHLRLVSASFESLKKLHLGKCHIGKVGKIWYSHKYNFGKFIKIHMFDGYASCSRVNTKCQVSLIIFDLQYTNNKRLRTAGLDHFYIHIIFAFCTWNNLAYIYQTWQTCQTCVKLYNNYQNHAMCVNIKIAQIWNLPFEFARIVEKIWQTPSELSLLSF